MKPTNENIKDYLRALLPPGTIVYTMNVHVAPSNMSAWIRLFVPVQDNGKLGIRSISHMVAEALEVPVHERKGEFCIRRTGCGYDRGFDIVYQLSHTLYGHGYTLKHEWL